MECFVMVKPAWYEIIIHCFSFLLFAWIKVYALPQLLYWMLFIGRLQSTNKQTQRNCTWLFYRCLNCDIFVLRVAVSTNAWRIELSKFKLSYTASYICLLHLSHAMHLDNWQNVCSETAKIQSNWNTLSENVHKPRTLLNYCGNFEFVVTARISLTLPFSELD